MKYNNLAKRSVSDSFHFWFGFFESSHKTYLKKLQILQVTAVDLDTGNNARLTYRFVSNQSDQDAAFGIFPNSGWIYIRASLDRESKERYHLVVAATDNGTPSQSATTKVLIDVIDANDNDPIFKSDSYHFTIEENLKRGAFVGQITATDRDSGPNAALRYSLIPGNTSFLVNALTGELSILKLIRILLRMGF